MQNLRMWLFPIGLAALWTIATAYTIAGAPI